MERRKFVLGLTAAAAAPGLACAAEPPLVAAAADLAGPLAKITQLFRRRAQRELRFIYGSSGDLVRQIEAGAPVELFLAGDERYVRALWSAGRTAGTGAVYGLGRIGLFTRRGSGLKSDPTLRDLTRALGDGRLKSFAVLDGARSPNGRASREALQHAGLWDALQPRLMVAANALELAKVLMSGAAQAGMAPLSAVRDRPLRTAGRFALVSADWHQPLKRRMVLTRRFGPTAKAFFAFLQGAEARRIFAEYGLTLPAGY